MLAQPVFGFCLNGGKLKMFFAHECNFSNFSVISHARFVGLSLSLYNISRQMRMAHSALNSWLMAASVIVKRAES
jgi:hypothetical protein